MYEDWVVGRKDIIKLLKIPMGLPEDYMDAWKKIKRWRKKGLKALIRHLPNGKPFVVKSEIEAWLESMKR